MYFVLNVCYIPFIPFSSKSSTFFQLSAEEMEEMSFFPLSSTRPEESHFFRKKLNLTMSDVISTSAVSGDQICSSMDSTTNNRNSTGPSDDNSTFHSSSGPLDKPVVSPQCSSLDETVSKDSLVHSLSTNPLSQDLISNSAGKDHLDCNHPQNSIHVSSDCTESHSSNYHNSVVLYAVSHRVVKHSCITRN